MDNDVEAVVLACRGTLASWSPALEAVAYEQARVNAESPLDRGAALCRRVEELSAGSTPSLAAGFERLAARLFPCDDETGVNAQQTWQRRRCWCSRERRSRRSR